jgi:hypothetical protein
MALKTRLTDLLNVRHPIMLAGMGGVSYAEVCAAMCNAGGYGVLGMAGTSPAFIAGQMKKVKELAPGKPFGVDLLAASPESLEESVDVIIKGGADSFVAGLGVPLPIMARLKAGGVKVMVVGGAEGGAGDHGRLEERTASSDFEFETGQFTTDDERSKGRARVLVGRCVITEQLVDASMLSLRKPVGLDDNPRRTRCPEISGSCRGRHRRR